MKNNEYYNDKLKQARIARAKKLALRKDRGESVKSIAASLGVTTARAYHLIASVRK